MYLELLKAALTFVGILGIVWIGAFIIAIICYLITGLGCKKEKTMTEELLKEIRETVYTLVDIANGKDIKLTPRQAKLAVRVMDLTEGYISSVDLKL